MGGIPITLLGVIEKEVDRFRYVKPDFNFKKIRKAGITPVFVFNGISTKKPRTETTEIIDKRRSAWSAYERGQVKEAGSLFLGNFFNTIFNTI
jgi:hypothetical protein